MTSAILMYESGNSKMVLWENPEDGVGERWSGGFRMGDGHAPMDDSWKCMVYTITIL